MTALALENIQRLSHRPVSKSRLFQKLFAAASEEAADAARDFCIELIVATLEASEHTRKRAGTVFLLYLDALNYGRPPNSRERRWRRFVSALALLSHEIRSQALRRLVWENADLLTPAA